MTIGMSFASMDVPAERSCSHKETNSALQVWRHHKRIASPTSQRIPALLLCHPHMGAFYRDGMRTYGAPPLTDDHCTTAYRTRISVRVACTRPPAKKRRTYSPLPKLLPSMLSVTIWCAWGVLS